MPCSSRFFAPFLTILCALACSKEGTPAPLGVLQNENGSETTESEAPVRGAEGDADEITTAPASAGTLAGSAGLLAEAQHVLETLTESTYSHKTHVAAPHGKHDARKQAHTTGVGRGVVVLEADAAGAPVAYHWTEIHSSPSHSTKIALGRAL